MEAVTLLLIISGMEQISQFLRFIHYWKNRELIKWGNWEGTVYLNLLCAVYLLNRVSEILALLYLWTKQYRLSYSSSVLGNDSYFTIDKFTYLWFIHFAFLQNIRLTVQESFPKDVYLQNIIFYIVINIICLCIFYSFHFFTL